MQYSYSGLALMLLSLVGFASAEHAKHHHLEHYFGQIDSNKDGKVTFNELHLVVQRGQKQGGWNLTAFKTDKTYPDKWVAEVCKASFDAADKDNSKDLSKDELLDRDAIHPSV